MGGVMRPAPPTAALALALLCLAPGCAKRPAAGTAPGAAQAPAERRYPLTGEVLGIDAARSVLRRSSSAKTRAAVVAASDVARSAA